jgi:hypothetical protein
LRRWQRRNLGIDDASGCNRTSSLRHSM